VFEANGFALEAVETIEQQVDPSLAAHYERMTRRALSSLDLITDAEFEHGLACMRAAVALETAPAPILETIDLLVFRRSR
jgi:hypothetical protein